MVDCFQIWTWWPFLCVPDNGARQIKWRTGKWLTSRPLSDIKGKHDDVIKWKLFLRYWPFVWGIHRSPVNSPHKGQWRGALMFSLICAWINGWANNGEAGGLRRHRAHCDVTVMVKQYFIAGGAASFAGSRVGDFECRHLSNKMSFTAIGSPCIKLSINLWLCR